MLLVHERPICHHVPDLDINGDTTDQLVAWIDSLPPNSIADGLGRTFVAERPLKFDDKTRLILRNFNLVREDAEHHGGIVYPKPNPHIWLLRPTACAVENVTVQGTNTVPDTNKSWAGAYLVAHEFEAAVRLEQFTDCAVTGLAANGVWGDGVQAQKGHGLTIDGLSVYQNGRQGVAVLGSDVTVRNYEIHSRRAGLDLEPDLATQSFGGVLIERGQIHAHLLAITSGGPGTFSGVEVRYNTIHYSGVPGINVRSSSAGARDRWWIHHNRIDGDGSPAPRIRLANSVGSVVEWNHVRHGSKQPPQQRHSVKAYNGSMVAVRHNWLEHSGYGVERDETSLVLDQNNSTEQGVPPQGFPAVGHLN